jgi:hypothetical protein
MYTDGLTEARKVSGEEYGLRLVDVAHRATRSLGDVLDAVVSDQSTFRADVPNSGDMTCLPSV